VRAVGSWATVIFAAVTLLGLPLLWLAWEIWTLSDSVPANHITAALRMAFERQPGVFVLLAGWYAFACGAIAGHVFWP